MAPNDSHRVSLLPNHYPKPFESWVDDLCARLGFIGDWVELGFRNFTSQIEISPTLFKIFNQ